MAETAKNSADSYGTHGRYWYLKIDEQASKKLRRQGHQKKPENKFLMIRTGYQGGDHGKQ
jgi:hypothetical protein